MEPMLTVLGIFLAIIVVLLLVSGVRIIQPYEQALWIVLGRYKRRLNPGFNMVYPLISRVLKLDLRTQVLDVPRQEVITKDNSPTNVDAIIYIRIVDPEKSYFEVQNYRLATVALGQTTLRSIIGDMELDEVLYNRAAINVKLRDILDEATDAWGVKVEAVEIREVEPSAAVKSAMEEQTSSERIRRATILKADGEKRGKILEAEGAKRSMILEAEGSRQAKILEAEGGRLAKILESQGEAQGLRILATGAAPLDQKALTVLSLDTLKNMATGQATKIIYPFEISKLLEGAADYIGVTRKVPPREEIPEKKLQEFFKRGDALLGKIPKPEEVKASLESIEQEMAAATEKTEELAKGLAKGIKEGEEAK